MDSHSTYILYLAAKFWREKIYHLTEMYLASAAWHSWFWL